MGKPTGFLEFERLHADERPIAERIGDYREIKLTPADEVLKQEGARCMDCGIPFCHSLGCPVYNLIPEWNDAIYHGQWREAWDRLELTNNLPEVTGRVCPAPCEASCTLAINADAVSIKTIEQALADRAFAEGWVQARPPLSESGRTVAIVGSGPAGLSAAQQLRRMGHRVTVFEKSDSIGGLLRYGIPDFKLEKQVLDRRIAQMEAEGVEFEANVVIGDDLSTGYVRRKFDVVLLAMGAGAARDLAVPGRELSGVHFALDYLTLSNRHVAGRLSTDGLISASGKNVMVIGGGDTGSDCVGTAIRQGARSVRQIEIMPKPREWTGASNPEWPNWPNILRNSTSHDEGCDRDWCVNTVSFDGIDGAVCGVQCERITWEVLEPRTRPAMVPVAGGGFYAEAELVLLAMGFVHVEHGGLVTDLGVGLDSRGNIETVGGYRTSEEGVFVAGDSHTGASLVVRAINHGRQAAEAIQAYLS